MATGGLNLAKKYSKKVDERFTRDSFLKNALHNDYDFTGAKTIEVYSIPTAAMNDYARTGTSRYGTPKDASRNIQELTISRDRSFTTIIDKGDKLQSEGVSDAGKFLARQIREVCVPEYDAYGFNQLAAAATAVGAVATTAATDENAYELFLNASERLGDKNVPDTGRIAYCSYRFANLLMRDPAFSKDTETAQKMAIKGVIGEVDGCRIVRVPAGRMPAGASFTMLHPMVACAPYQLEEFKIHENPPGISGWLVEGRFIYDLFTLNNKVDGLFYHGGQAIMKILTVTTAASEASKSAISVNPFVKSTSTNKWYYDTATTLAGLIAVTYGSAITPGNWLELTVNGTEITPESDRYVRVVEVNSSNEPVSVGDSYLNIG